MVYFIKKQDTVLSSFKSQHGQHCDPSCSSVLAPTIEFEQASYQVREPPGPDGIEVLNIKVNRRGDLDRTSKVRCSTRDGSAQSGVDYNPKSRVLKFTTGQYLKLILVTSPKREHFCVFVKLKYGSNVSLCFTLQGWTTSCSKWRFCPMRTGSGMSPSHWFLALTTLWRQCSGRSPWQL